MTIITTAVLEDGSQVQPGQRLVCVRDSITGSGRYAANER